MKFLKKSIAFLLAVCMLLSYMPMHVHAAGSTSGTGFYKIVHLDAGRKYISVEVVKKYIDAMAEEGYNQLTLYFSDNQGFRFKLDDMSLTVNGTDYTSRIESAIGNGYNQPADGTGTGDWFRHSLEPDGTKNYYTEDDMTEIITYATSKGIDLVPAFDMPGHMGAILEVFTEFRYTGSSTTSWSTLDVDNETARAFALALLQKYVDFFADAGCEYFSICADEFCYDTGAGNIKSTTLANIMLFMDEAAQMIDEAGMVPRCFNDWLYSSTAYTPSAAYGKYEVYYWGNRGYATPAALIAKGHKIINTGEAAYYALGSNWYSEAGTDAGVKAFDPYVIATKSGSFSIDNPAGVCFAIWCDRGYFDANTANTGAEYEPSGGDGGKILFAETEGYLRLFAQSVRERMREPVTVNLTVGQTYSETFTLSGQYTADQIAEKYGFGSVITATNINYVGGSEGTPEVAPSVATELVSGNTYLISDGNGNYLTSSLGNTTSASEAGKWVITLIDGSNYYIQLEGNTSYLSTENVSNGKLSLLAGQQSAVWIYDSANQSFKASRLKAWWPEEYADYVLSYSNGTWSGVENGTASAALYIPGTPAVPGTDPDTTFSITGAAAGSVTIGYNGTEYIFNVTSTAHTCDSNVAATCIKGASCSVCGVQQSTALDENNHVGPIGTATCASGAVCDACKKVVGDPDATNHTGGTEVRDAVAATTTSEGYTGDTYCLGCNNMIKTGETIPVIVEPVDVSCSCGDHTVTVTANNLTELVCGGAQVDVVSVAGAAHTVAYDLTPKTASGNYTGSATVSVPVPSGWDTNKIFAFVVNSNGSITRIDATVADGRVTYTCPHFSTTGVAEEITADYNINIDYSANPTVSSETIDVQLAANGTTGNTDNGLASYTVAVTEIPATGGSGASISAWESGKSYAQGDLVEYNGNVFYRKYGGSDGTPDASAQWGAWGLVNEWSAAGYEGNTVVSYNGEYYKASGWAGEATTPGVDAIWVKLDVGSGSGSTGEPTYTTVVTFTATGTNGVDTATIGGEVFKVTVTGGTDPDVGGDTCEHEWETEYTYDATNHWIECSLCGEKKDITGHSGGTPNCYNRAHCTTCGGSYGDVDPDNHKDPADPSDTNHADYVQNAEEATATEDGYTGDIICGWCDTIRTPGTVIPATGSTCEHDWETEYTYDTTNHWIECSLCGEKKDITAHSGSTADCQNAAHCSVCGQTYGTTNPNNHVGPMTDVDGTYVAPTDDTDGKAADQVCGACGVTVTGAVIPALNAEVVEITVAVGGTHQFVIDGRDATSTIDRTSLDEATASVAGVLTPGTDPIPEVLPSAVTELVSGNTYVFSDGNGNYLTSSLGNTTTAAEAGKWVITLDANSGNYYIQPENASGTYLSIEDVSSGRLALLGGNQSGAWIYDSTTKSFKANRLTKWYPEERGDYVLSYSNSTWVGVLNGTAPATLCVPGSPAIPGTDPKTTITFTGNAIGTTYVTVDGTRYKINVVDAELLNAVLATPTWMTNREVSGFLNADGSASSFARQITAADHIAITTENGVALSDIVPNEATTVADATTDSHAIFWRGMRHASGQVQGTSTDFHQVGDVINYVRYYNGAWEGSADRTNWMPLAGYTLDLYYLQETAVTKEVITEVVDWGEDYNQGLGWEASTYVLLDFAVALDGVGRHPALTAYPNNGDGTTVENQKTIAFHCTHTSDDKTMAKDGTWQRRVDSIFAEETGLYEVYMITITRTSDTPTMELPGNNSNECGSYSYEGTERIIWTIDEATFTEKFGQTTTDGNVLGAFDLRPAGFDITNKDHKATMYRTVGGDPIVDYVQIYENQGLLVTYYVRAKRTEDSLTVHYRVEGTDTDFHNYYIAVEQGHFFNDGFAASETHAGGLVNNTVTNFYGNTHTVNSDLTKLFDVPAQYRTGLYEFNHHVQLVLDDGTTIEDEEPLPAGRKIKEVILYYRVDNIHYVPIDYSNPVPITNEFFEHHVESGRVVSASLTRYPASGPADAYGSYKITDEGTFYLLDTVMRGSGDAFTFDVVVEVPNNSGGYDPVPETHQVVLVPATTVDYDGFYLRRGIESGWASFGDRNETNNQQARCYKDEGAVNFGYDGVNKDLLGSATHGMTVTSTTAGSSLTFEFTGTGFDLRAHCTSTSGQIMVLVRNADTDALVRLSMVDTRIMSGSTDNATMYEFDNSYNVPVISILGLPHGNYSVQVNHIANTTYVDEYEKDENDNPKLDENGKPIVNRVPVVRPLPVTLSGFRIYNTMLSTDYATGGVAAGDIYTSEKDPTFVELRDVALAGVYVESSYAGHEDQIYADQIADNIMSQVHATGRETIQGLIIGKYTDDNLASTDAVRVDIIDNGPKNEIYLWPGQTLAIGCSTNISAQIGLRSVDGAAVTFKLDGDQDVINTSTDMYYVVDGSDGFITVENVSGGVLSVTTLKKLAIDYTPDIEPLTMPRMMMFFRARGFAESAPVKEGIVEEDGKKYYYVDGEKNYAGLIEIDGSYYYVRTSGEIVCGKSYWVTKTNGLVEAGFYTFDADGKMENCTIGANGIVEENGVKYYYVDGVKTYAGLIEIDGDYYYVRSSGEVVCGKTYWVTKTNDLMDANNYTFGADGKMINPPTNGIVEENGKLFYYENGKKTYAGLIEIDGSYYYVRSSGEVVCNRSYYISKSNDLMPLGNYTFGADGKMIMN